MEIKKMFIVDEVGEILVEDEKGKSFILVVEDLSTGEFVSVKATSVKSIE